MENTTIIRLLPKAEYRNNNYHFLNVFRGNSNYENIHAYFFRSQFGTAVILNDDISADKQAQAIFKIKKGIHKCKTAEMGIVDGNGVYHCGGSLCCRKK